MLTCNLRVSNYNYYSYAVCFFLFSFGKNTTIQSLKIQLNSEYKTKEVIIPLMTIHGMAVNVKRLD